jgi:hypothetical protein
MKKFSSRFFVAILFIYISEIIINQIVRNTESLHFGKDGGSVAVAFFHCLASYICFILIQRNILTWLGLGFFIGLFSCVFELYLENLFSFNFPKEWYNFLLFEQITCATICLIIGVAFYFINKRFIELN